MENLGIVLMCVSIIPLVLGLFLTINAIRFKKICDLEARGKVVGIEKRKTREGLIRYYPSFQFYVNKVSVKKTSKQGSNPSKFNIGDTVDIFYNAANPQQFYVSGDKTTLLSGVLFLIIAVALVIVGVIVKTNY